MILSEAFEHVTLWLLLWYRVHFQERKLRGTSIVSVCLRTQNIHLFSDIVIDDVKGSVFVRPISIVTAAG
jgi:hypothetical protein